MGGLCSLHHTFGLALILLTVNSTDGRLRRAYQ